MRVNKVDVPKDNTDGEGAGSVIRSILIALGIGFAVAIPLKMKIDSDLHEQEVAQWAQRAKEATEILQAEDRADKVARQAVEDQIMAEKRKRETETEYERYRARVVPAFDIEKGPFPLAAPVMPEGTLR
jgi:uncharacterized protein HemX